MKKFIVLILCAVMLFQICSCEKKDVGEYGRDKTGLTDNEFTIYNTVSQDALGRKMNAISDFRNEKYVGLFYFPWLDSPKNLQVYNISEILATDPDALWSTDPNNAVSPIGTDHMWGEPLYGYYNSDDEWVMRRHIEIWINSGVDFLYFDVTNGFTYDSVWMKLMPLLDYYNKQGWNSPKVVFYCHASSVKTISHFYENLYSENYFPSTWFAPNGKPMIVGATRVNEQAQQGTTVEFLPQEIKDFFDIKYAVWPDKTKAEHENSLPWIDWAYPQTIYPSKQDGLNAMNVSVSQHVGLPFSNSVYFADDDYMYNSNWGRGYDFDFEKNDVERVAEGSNFEMQWQNAINHRDEVDIVMTTSWNEWIVGKGSWPVEPYVNFIDTINQEFSRDIEMMRGGHKDNYVMQFARNIRNFKTTDTKENPYVRYKMNTTDKFGLYMSNEKWGNIGNIYLDLKRDAVERNALDILRRNYITDMSNRNDIIKTRVVNDSNYLYIMVETAKEIVEDYGSGNWMNILISTGGDKNWEGYNFLVNRKPQKNGITSLEFSTGNGFEWKDVGEINYRMFGNRIIFAIPLKKIVENKSNFVVDFKVTDNITYTDDIMEYYVSGDSAPIGRFNYRYDLSR